MSYKAIFDLFLQIHSFSNIDLPSQGLFRLRASLYQLDGTQVCEPLRQKIFATPFQFMQPSKKQTINLKKIFHRQTVQPPYFSSKTGAIRYSDDIVNLDDQIRFKLEIQSFPRLHSQNIFLDVDLFFSECYYSSSIHQFEGEKVETKTFKLQNLEQGLLNYCQGQFIGNYSSKFTFTIFACLSDFKFGRYKLSEQMKAIFRQDSEGNIKSQFVKPIQNVRQKQLQRSKIESFCDLIKWVNKYYKQKIPDSLKYFYHTYVKNLRYFFYLTQQKLNSKSIITKKMKLKVPKGFLELPDSKSKQNQNEQTQIRQKQFKKYMTDYEPQQLTLNLILNQVNAIHFDIYMFLMEVEKQFQLDQLMSKKMKEQYQTYIKERYGERVFKSIVTEANTIISSKQNQKIAKSMRQKQKIMKLVNYPIQDIAYTNNKQMLEFLFYEITTKKKNQKSNIILKSVKSINSIQEDKKKQEVNTSKNIINTSNILQQILKQRIQVQQTFQKQLQKSQNQIKNNLKDIVIRNQQDQVYNNKQQNNSKKQIVLENSTQLSEKQTKQKQVKSEHKNQNNIKSQKKQQQKRVNAETEESKVKKQEQKKQQNQWSDDEQDVYKNVSHEKGQIDSQLSQRSLQQHQHEKEYGNEGMSDISDINIIQNPNKQKTIQQTQQFQQHQPLIYDEKDMLIVLCHGFQGTAYDMAMVVRGIRQLLPQASYLISRVNEGQTQGNIDQMGERLAQEIQSYIKNYMDKDTVIINFVGHSMGGVVARAGIKYMPKYYKNQYGFFCSLSSPHLGYLTGVDGMIKAGLWAILKFKPITSLQQLTMDDAKDVRKTFLYNLSKEGSLSMFRRIILFSSFEDSYVPWHSARISLNSKKNIGNSKVEQQMVSNILGNQPIHRIDVNFNVKTKNLDSFIGRTAHINLIVQQSLFKIIKFTIPDLFNLSIE